MILKQIFPSFFLAESQQTKSHDDVISEYIEKYSRYDYSFVSWIHTSSGHSRYYIDGHVFMYYENMAYIIIDDKTFYVTWVKVSKFFKILEHLFDNTCKLKNKFLFQTQHFSMPNLTDKILIEKFEEFEVIKNGKLDQISYDSLIEYYAR